MFAKNVKIILCKCSPLRHLCKWKYSYFLMGTPFKALNKIWKTEIVNLGKVNKSFFLQTISAIKYDFLIHIINAIILWPLTTCYLPIQIFKYNRKFLKHILGHKFMQSHTLIVCLIRVWRFWIEAKFLSICWCLLSTLICRCNVIHI